MPFGICHCFKAEKQQEKFQRENALAANESTPRCGLINLINSHLAFSFFHFSTTTLLQLGVSSRCLSPFHADECVFSLNE